ncbi:MAG: glycosyltransferase [Bacteroidia bacterium]|nr:glycosyltransferase [Bacteroidia bacterium]
MGKRVLVAPLDWGLGHATRCIPVIWELQNQDVEVVIGVGSDSSKHILQEVFPSNKFIEINGYNISYPSNGNMAWSMMLKTPSILKRIKKEHNELDSFIEEFKLDAVISDNRYGLWSDKIYSILITHQLNIQTPNFLTVAKPVLGKLTDSFIKKFDECWIPDFKDENSLSGKLSINAKDSCLHIGPLSRFQLSDNIPLRPPYRKGDYSQEKKWDITAIVSGPEPQRTIFEELLITQLKSLDSRCLIIGGKPNIQENREIGTNITFVNHLSPNKFKEAILSSEILISRPGYSTIMDLYYLGAKAVFVPTPGQTEQEYLADYHFSQGNFYSQEQNKFDIKTALLNSGNYSRLINKSTYNLNRTISDFIARV